MTALVREGKTGPTIALDRLIHNAYNIKLKGESMRKEGLTQSVKKV